MKFDDFPLNKAKGAILAHTIRLEKLVLKKGHKLTQDNIIALQNAHIETVSAAILEDGDVEENLAAERVAKAVAGKGVTLTPSTTGRCNLVADFTGLLKIDVQQVNTLNMTSEAVTVATLSNYSSVVPGEVIATIKIIPYSVPDSTLNQIVNSVNSTALKIHPFNKKNIGLIQTRVKGGRENLLDKTRNVLESRLQNLGLGLSKELRCDHNVVSLGKTLGELLDSHCDLVVIGGNAATVDRNDIVPTAIVNNDGVIDHFGMPVEPGNLLLLGHHQNTPIIGMPGCARSIKENGFDWVLQRLLTNIGITPEDIMMMGIGGLISDRSHRKLRPGRMKRNEMRQDGISELPKTAAIILAAGQSRRMGDTNKLLAEFRGKPILEHVIETAKASKVTNVTVITGYQHEAVEEVAHKCGVDTVHCDDFHIGMSRSLIAGIKNLSADIEAAVICLGDMPLVQPEHLNRLISSFDPQADSAICISSYEGKRGNPVLWSRDFFEEICTLKGDMGARSLLNKYADLVAEVEMDNAGVLTDIDTPQDLSQVTNDR